MLNSSFNWTNINKNINTNRYNSLQLCQFIQALRQDNNKKLMIIALTAFCTFCKRESLSFIPMKKQMNINLPLLFKKCTFKWNKCKKTSILIPNVHMHFKNYLIISSNKITQTIMQQLNNTLILIITSKIMLRKRESLMKDRLESQIMLNWIISKKHIKFQFELKNQVLIKRRPKTRLQFWKMLEK